MKNLILGTISGYSFETIYPFIETFKRTHNDSELVLFYNNMHMNVLDKIKEYSNVKLVHINPSSRHVVNARFFSYLDFLKNNINYNYVFITDVRDVFFQKDSFLFDRPDAICVFQEDALLKHCVTNKSWIYQSYDNMTYDKIEQFPILCAGAFMGPLQTMINFLELFCNELIYIESKRSGIINSVWGADQAVLNVLIYSKDFNPVVRYTTKDGPVVHIIHTDPSTFRFNSDGLLINDIGVISAIHEYDRKPILKNIMLKMIPSVHSTYSTCRNIEPKNRKRYISDRKRYISGRKR